MALSPALAPLFDALGALARGFADLARLGSTDPSVAPIPARASAALNQERPERPGNASPGSDAGVDAEPSDTEAAVRAVRAARLALEKVRVARADDEDPPAHPDAEGGDEACRDDGGGDEGRRGEARREARPGRGGRGGSGLGGLRPHIPLRRSAEALLSDAALAAALPAAAGEDLRQGRAAVLVVLVPSRAWVGPLTGALKRAPGGTGLEVVPVPIRPRPQGAWSRESDPDEAATRKIRQGGPVVAIAPDASFLSPVYVAAADHVVTVPPPGLALVAEVVRAWAAQEQDDEYGWDEPRDDSRPVPSEGAMADPAEASPASGALAAPTPLTAADLTADDLAGLDLTDLVAALRRGADEASCVERLRRASRSRVGLTPDEAANVPPLADLTGYGEAHEWALGLVADIARVRAGKLKANLLEGAVLAGPPGTGKTTLAKAIAVAAGVPYRETTVGGWFSGSSGHLDGVVKAIDGFCDGLLLAARSAGAGTAVGFLDELDALPDRAALDGRNRDWWTPVITHCLTRLEALRRAGIVLLAATNHVGNVDAALLRPGRFDRLFYVPLPDEEGRLGILRAHLDDALPEADLTTLARLTPDATGAVLAGGVRAARRRAEAGEHPLTMDDLMDCLAPPDPRPPETVRRVALHEAGHAVAAVRLGIGVRSVSIQPSGDAGGVTQVTVKDVLPDRAGLERQVVGLLAGRAADARLGDGPNAAAATDLIMATRLVAALHGSLGLGSAGLVARAPMEVADVLVRQDARFARLVEDELARLMVEAEVLVLANRAAIGAVAEALIERRVLSGDEVAALLVHHPARLRVKAGKSGWPGNCSASN